VLHVLQCQFMIAQCCFTMMSDESDERGISETIQFLFQSTTNNNNERIFDRN
jgi:hypothetical protein